MRKRSILQSEVDASSVNGRKETAKTNARQNTIFADFAPLLHQLGYSPIPLVGKTPRIRRWPEYFCDERPTIERTEGEYSRRHRSKYEQDGIGLATYGGLIFIDIDADGAQHHEVYALVRAAVPSVDRAPRIIGRRGAKYVMRLDNHADAAGLNLGGTQTGGVIEILAYRRQGVIPPTLHPDTGSPYVFDTDANRQVLLETRFDDLVRISANEVRKLHAVFDLKRKAPQIAERARQASKVQREARRAVSQWDGSDLEVRRIASALKFVDPNDEDSWWKVGAALHNWTRGHLMARELFDAWSGGGTFKDTEFAGAPSKFNKTKTQDDAWMQDRPAIGIGSIIHLAQQQGFDAKLGHWPALKIARLLAAETLKAADTPFVIAGRELPKENVDFHESREALRTRALNDPSIKRSDVRLLDQILNFVNQTLGYAWPSYERLAGNVGISEQQLYKHASALENAGYIIRAQNNLNPDCSTRTAFAVLPPVGMTWQQLLDWHRQQSGHKTHIHQDVSRKSETGFEQGEVALSIPVREVKQDWANPPCSELVENRTTGHADPDTTNRESSSGVEDAGERPDRRGTGPEMPTLNNLIEVGILENADLVKVMENCCSDRFGLGMVQSIILLVGRALKGIDGAKEPNLKIAIGEQQARRATEKAFSLSFDPIRRNDNRKKRMDLNYEGSEGSRKCLRLFRSKLEIELGKIGYETDSFIQQRAAWRDSRSASNNNSSRSITADRSRSDPTS